MSTKSVLFIDSRVSIYQSFIDSLTEPTEVFVLDSASDGLSQMATYLYGRTGIDAIHVISHGSVGTLYLGSTVLDGGNLGSYQSQLASIGSALTETGDILLYGCNVAQGDLGVQFIGNLAQATGADVAGSSAATGDEALGGDWVLERATGTVDVFTLKGLNLTGLLSANTAPAFPLIGKVTTDFNYSLSDEAQSVILQADGKILVAGGSGDGSSISDFVLARYNIDGSLDTSFSGDGKLTTSIGGFDFGKSVVIQRDGKILVAGGSDSSFALVRYYSDGSLDTTFSGDGKVTTAIGSYDSGSSVTLQADGKILVAGSCFIGNNTVGHYEVGLLRYLSDGSLDTTFSSDGKVSTAIGTGNSFGKSVAVQADGKILVAGYCRSAIGYDFSLIRYNADGSLDNNFSSDGKVTTTIGSGNNEAYGIVIQGDGKIVLAGRSSDTPGGFTDFSVVRYNTDGSLDTSFSGDGKVTAAIGTSIDDGYSLALQVDGKILVAGNSWSASDFHHEFAVARFNTDGSPDVSFSDDGKVTTPAAAGGEFATSIAAQANGQIVVAGRTGYYGKYDFSLVRYNSDGSLNVNFDSVGALNNTPQFIEGNAPISLDSTVSIFDAELSGTSYSGATIVLARLGGANSTDTFSAGGNLGAFSEGSPLTLSGVSIGTVTKNSVGSLAFRFNSSATQTRVNETLSSIRYANSSDTPSSSAVIEWLFNDGNTGAQGTGGSLTVHGTIQIALVGTNDKPTGGITITGTPTQGRTLSANTLTLADADGLGAISYQWMANGINISGATGSTLTLSQAQVGKGISVKTSYIDGYGTAESVTSNSIAINSNAPPTLSISTIPQATFEREFNDDYAHATNFVNSATGSLSGASDVDWFTVYLNASNAKTVTFDTSSMNFGMWNVYWYDPNMQAMSGRNIGASIDSATLTYDIVAPTTGTYYVRVQPSNPTFYNGGLYKIYFPAADAFTYTDTSANDSFSNKTGVLLGSDIDIGTTLTYGIAGGIDNGSQVSKTGIFGTLTVIKATGAYTFVPNNAAIQAIASNTSETYKVNVSDGAAITETNYTLTLVGANDAPTGTVVISGTLTPGKVLSASNSIGDRDGLGAISYQWMANGINISGANGSTMTLSQAQVGKAISVKTSYIDGHGTAESVTSSSTGVVVDPNQAPSVGHVVSLSFASKVDYAAGTNPWSIASSDVNGDGKVDLVFTNYNSSVASVMLNNGDGTFVPKADFTAGMWPRTVASADVNGDGFADVIVANATPTVSVLLSNGNGTFATKIEYATANGPQTVINADVNGDGKVDIVTSNVQSDTISVLLNNGNGTFATHSDYATGAWPMSLASADVNGDGKADIITTNTTAATISVLLNNGNGTFASKVDYAAGSNPIFASSTDVNGDGFADILVDNTGEGSISVLMNNGNGTFASRVDYVPGGYATFMGIADINGDGKPDLLVADRYSSTIAVMLNNGNGTFASTAKFGTGSSPYAFVSADVNGDGRPDLLSANYDGNSVSVLLNNGVSNSNTAFTEQTPVSLASTVSAD